MNLNLRTYLLIIIIISSLSLFTNNILLQIIHIVLDLITLFLKNCNLKILKYKKIRILFKVFITLFIMQILFRRNGVVIFHFGIIKITLEGIKFAFASIARLFVISLLCVITISVRYDEFGAALFCWKIPNDKVFIIY